MLFLGYSMTDPDFLQIQAELLHVLGGRNPRNSYAVMFGSDEISRADCETRNISIVDLGPRTGDEGTDTLADFLETLVNIVRHTPYIPRESHDASEATKVVPKEVQAEFQKQGYQLICCIEYRTYCATFDEGNFVPILSGWTLSGHLKTGQRWSGQIRPTNSGTNYE
jgi:hypothetical protein